MERWVVFLYLQMPSESNKKVILNVLTGNNLRVYGWSSFVPFPAKPAKQSSSGRYGVAEICKCRLQLFCRGRAHAEYTDLLQSQWCDVLGPSWAEMSRALRRINRPWTLGDSTEISDDETGIILHEFGHALGILHEYQSPLRGDKRKRFVLLLLFCLLS